MKNNDLRNNDLSDEELAKVTGGVLSSTDGGKPYHCQYCGAGFDTEAECSTHEASCPSKPRRGIP